jgi:lipoate synthase
MGFQIKTPLLATDVIIRLWEEDKFKGIVLIERKYPPVGLALPGGFVEIGETVEEVIQTMKDLRGVGLDIITIGQYLQPSKKHLPVKEFITPEQFKEYETLGLEMGFMYVESGPLVRSSYKAHKHAK